MISIITIKLIINAILELFIWNILSSLYKLLIKF